MSKAEVLPTLESIQYPVTFEGQEYYTPQGVSESIGELVDVLLSRVEPRADVLADAAGRRYVFMVRVQLELVCEIDEDGEILE